MVLFFRTLLPKDVLLVVLSFFSFVHFGWNQECKTTVNILLENIDGGLFTNKKVRFTKIGTSVSLESKSNYMGIASAQLDCGSRYELAIENYTRKEEIRTPERASGSVTFTYTYSHDMAEKDKIFAMTAEQKNKLESEIKLLPDTTIVKASKMIRPLNYTDYSSFHFKALGLDNKPLVEETVTFTGRTRNKSFQGKTNEMGEILVYLPKGDEYSINFLYNKNFAHKDIPFSQGTSDGFSEIQYIGTKEILRRKKLEEERIKAEEERLVREEKEFIERCKREKIEKEKAIKLELERAIKEKEEERIALAEAKKKGVEYVPKPRVVYPTYPTRSDAQVVDKVLSRNNWTQKLIVCDVTGSMNPYVSQLVTWYQLNLAKEKNLQFVFFNDGDNKKDSEKTIGKTGGIYYKKATNIEDLISEVSFVSGKGSGGDCPENNMEALIKGTSMAAPYKELVMVADNQAPVKDIKLLLEFKKPVHIILCGANSGFVNADYLKIAWKTKGSVHTIEEDITKIASMLEGETIQIMGKKFKIMGGEFVQLTGI